MTDEVGVSSGEWMIEEGRYKKDKLLVIIINPNHWVSRKVTNVLIYWESFKEWQQDKLYPLLPKFSQMTLI